MKDKSNSVVCQKKKNVSSLSCQLSAEEAYTTVSCNEKIKEHVSMPAGPEAKESPGFFDLMAFSFEVLIFFALWFSADSRKLNSDEVRSMTNSKTMWSTEDRSHTKLRREDFARSILPWRRAPDQRQRSVRRYLYISWQKAKSTRNCGARLRLAPIMCIVFYGVCVCLKLCIVLCLLVVFYGVVSKFKLCMYNVGYSVQ